MSSDEVANVEEQAPDAQQAKKKKLRSRILGYVIVLCFTGIIIAAAAYQEEISAFLRLKMWDKGGPSRAVVSFLGALKKGDQNEAKAFLGASNYQPVIEGGKFKGYLMQSMAGNMKFLAEDLVGDASDKAISTEYMTIGNGAAKVVVSDAKGKPVKYTVEMINGTWKITEILAGRPVK